MAFQVSARAKRGGTVGIFVESAREAMDEADKYAENGFTDIEFRDEEGNLMASDVVRQLAKR